MQYDYWSRKLSRLHYKRKGRKTPVQLLLLLLVLLCAFVVLPKAWHYIAGPADSRPDSESAGAAGGKEAEAGLSPEREAVPEKPLDPWKQAFGKDLEIKTVTVSPGDTLINILLDAGLPSPEVYNICGSLSEVFDPSNLRQGQELTLSFDNGVEEDLLLKGLCLKLDVDREVQVMRSVDEDFLAREFIRELASRPAQAAADIDTSLYEAAIEADLPVDILMQMVRAYSYDVDFQRDIQPGDKFEVLYEEKIDSEGDVLKSGGVLYAVLHTRGRALSIYRYEPTDGETDFFDEQGKSVRKTLMVTPIDGARISSRYGMRRHPIQGYNKMHRGLDFAAPTGTPIMAAGDGIIEYAGRNGGYGHYVRIRHPNEYKTIYGHMSRYARGIRSGARVKQGDTIGYVGSTGISTGPHLHYEVQHRRKAVNPASVKTPPGRTLKGDELQKFLQVKKRLEKTYASFESGSQAAEAAPSQPRETPKQ